MPTPQHALRMDDAIWRPALAKAHAAGTDLTAVIRDHLIAYVAEGAPQLPPAPTAAEASAPVGSTLPPAAAAPEAPSPVGSTAEPADRVVDVAQLPAYAGGHYLLEFGPPTLRRRAQLLAAAPPYATVRLHGAPVDVLLDTATVTVHGPTTPPREVPADG